MIWYWYYCYPLFWCAWRSMYSESFHRVRERWLWEMESLRWRCQTETVMWNQRWFCLDHPIAFQKCLSFKTHWDLQGRCSKRGQFSMWLISCLRTFTPSVKDFRGQWLGFIHTAQEKQVITSCPAMSQFTWIFESSYQTATQERCLGTSAGQLENGKVEEQNILRLTPYDFNF